MKTIIYFIATFVLVCSFFACDNDDKFSSNSDLRLSFSADTVRFDTIFTTLGTATKRLKVYNKNSDAISIGSVSLMSPDKTGFRMNVDGESGNEINNVDILGKDSLYVFVEVTVDPLDQNTPMLIADSIRFQFNGVTQYVRLEAIGQDIIIWRGKTIDQDTTLVEGKPFLIYDYLYVEKGATLNIEKNVQLYFNQGAELSVAGQINAIGTIQEPVIFRGDRRDNIFENPPLPYDRIPGQWDGIKIASDSYNNRFENVRIRNGIYGIVFEASDTIKQKATLLNTVIQNTTKETLSSINSKIEARNCLFANSGSYTLKLVGGSYDFLHCTVTNYMNYTGTSKKGVVYIGNTDTDENGKTVSADLGTCRFRNSILSGNAGTRDITFNSSSNTLLFNYKFINCLLNMKGTDDKDFENTVWNQDPLFTYIYATGDAQTNPNVYFLYDFTLTENSPARNRALLQYANELPVDILGQSRLSDNTPDIGCFEWKR